MNEARLVDIVEPSVVPATDREQPASVAHERKLPLVDSEPRLGRPLAVSLCITVVLAFAAFWPAAPDRIAARPALKAPIVLDVLNPAPLPQVAPDSKPEQSAAAAAPPPP